ncbi:MAG: hypothetical protein WBA93_20385 [Microcoleaceae cyanobacterium]
MKNPPVESIKKSLDSVVEHIFSVGKISALDRKFLRLALFSSHSLTVTEQDQIKLVYEELKAGRIVVAE